MNEQVSASEPAPQDRNYNGWANYPTWAAYLWLSNDEGSYYAAEDIVREAGDSYHAAAGIKTWVQEANPLADDASLYADVLGWALQIVDWDSVARAFSPDDDPMPGAADAGDLTGT